MWVHLIRESIFIFAYPFSPEICNWIKGIQKMIDNDFSKNNNDLFQLNMSTFLRALSFKGSTKMSCKFINIFLNDSKNWIA